MVKIEEIQEVEEYQDLAQISHCGIGQLNNTNKILAKPKMISSKQLNQTYKQDDLTAFEKKQTDKISSYSANEMYFMKNFHEVPHDLMNHSVKKQKLDEMSALVKESQLQPKKLTEYLEEQEEPLTGAKETVMNETTNYVIDKLFDHDEESIKVINNADNIEKYAISKKLTREAKR